MPNIADRFTVMSLVIIRETWSSHHKHLFLWTWHLMWQTIGNTFDLYIRCFRWSKYLWCRPRMTRCRIGPRSLSRHRWICLLNQMSARRVSGCTKQSLLFMSPRWFRVCEIARWSHQFYHTCFIWLWTCQQLLHVRLVRSRHHIVTGPFHKSCHKRRVLNASVRVVILLISASGKSMQSPFSMILLTIARCLLVGLKECWAQKDIVPVCPFWVEIF